MVGFLRDCHSSRYAASIVAGALLVGFVGAVGLLVHAGLSLVFFVFLVGCSLGGLDELRCLFPVVEAIRLPFAALLPLWRGDVGSFGDGFCWKLVH